MGNEEIERIKQIFSKLQLNPVYKEHEAVITSQDAARTRGDELKQGIKALLFTNGKDEWIIVNVPSDLKVDVKKVCAKIGWSKSSFRMGTPQEVIEKTGCEIGAVPPFGHKEKINILVDSKIYQNEESAFNIGLRTHSVKIKTVQMKSVFSHESAVEGDFSKT